MAGWNTSALSGLSPYWTALCANISAANLSPYNSLFQAMMAANTTNIQFTANIGGTQYGYSFNIVPDTTPLADLSDVVVNPPSLTQIPFTGSQYTEEWPVNYTVDVENGSATVTGSGFKVTPTVGVNEWPVIAGGYYLINETWASAPAAPSDYGTSANFLVVEAVASDTSLTLTAPYAGSTANGVTLTGPYNVPNQFYFDDAVGLALDEQDHHQYVAVISSSTGTPSALYESWDLSSAATPNQSGGTWDGNSHGAVAYWDLVTGAQNPSGYGAASAAGLPYWPLGITYDEITQGEILHAIPCIIGDGAYGIGAPGCVWPAPTSNQNDNPQGSTRGYLLGGVPLGGRLRLKSSFNISGYSATNQIILQAMKTYGLINLDWEGTGEYQVTVSMAYDARWNMADLENLWSIPTTELELVDTIWPRFTWSGPTTLAPGIEGTWTLTQNATDVSNDTNYSTSGNMYVYWSDNNWASNNFITEPSGFTQSSPGPYSFTWTPPGVGSYQLTYILYAQYWLYPLPYSVTVETAPPATPPAGSSGPLQPTTPVRSSPRARWRGAGGTDSPAVVSQSVRRPVSSPRRPRRAGSVLLPRRLPSATATAGTRPAPGLRVSSPRRRPRAGSVLLPRRLPSAATDPSMGSDPSVTFNAQYNALASGSLSASGTTTFTADFSSSKLGGFVQIWDTGGATVAATNGCQVQCFATADTGPNYDTIAFAGTSFTITTVASTAAAESFFLPTGKYKVQLTNLDATYAITVGATTAPVA